MIFGKWWGRRPRNIEETVPTFPPGTRIYAIGDIHGRADLLKQLFELISKDLQEQPCGLAIELYVGDYIDRGPQSCEVVEMLASPEIGGRRRICLKGNHEQIFEDFLVDPNILQSWAALGGLETLQSYGIRTGLNPRHVQNRAICSQLLFELPQKHREFFKQLQMSFRIGNYFFVHAGVRPGVKLAEQRIEDLLWIREPFLGSMRNHGAVVVHGHTPGEDPVILPNRICIDTGAYITGKLTCLVLQGDQQRFITATT